MSIATPALDALRDTLPDDLKDIRLNLASVLAGENLTPAQALPQVPRDDDLTLRGHRDGGDSGHVVLR